MRIDHGPTQALSPHHVPVYSHLPTVGNLPGVRKHVIAMDSNRLAQAEIDDSALTNREMCPIGLGSQVDGFERKGQAWFVATELQSDLVVEVGDMSFHLHKFPLLSRSGKLNRLVFDSRDTENSHIKLDNMPGGPETFELAAKFCYGVALELTSANVAALRCAAEYLEMTEDLEEGNLVSKTEAFLSFVVLASWKDSVTVLQSCEKLATLAEQLQIVRRCCESIAWKACTDPRGIPWSFSERIESKKSNHTSPIWTGPKSQGGPTSDQVPSDWWIEDICSVCVTFFKKIIQAIKVKGMRYELIAAAIMHYAMKWLPGLTRDFADAKETPVPVEGSFLAVAGVPRSAADNNDDLTTLDISQDNNRHLIETLIPMLPTQKDGVPCTFVLRLLRLAKMVGINPMLITELEKRAGLQLDQGTLSDLLIPSFDHTCETLFDVDLVQRMLDYFLLQDFVLSPGALSPAESDKDKSPLNPTVDKVQTPHSTYVAKMRVAKLIDNYLAEVGRDQNLTLNKFLALAEALPEHTRVTDDGLYKAIDTYLKAHPVLTEHDRKKLCRTLDCQRLSLDACMHAAQNERLPLRIVVQVLFGEQIKLRNAVTGTSSLSKEHSGPYPADDNQTSSGGSSRRDSYVHDREPEPEDEPQEIDVLRSDVERMKGKFMALQHDYTAIQQQLAKLMKNPKPHSGVSGWKKLFPHAHLPHPHFHVPHFLTHPMDLFHHKDHHHLKDKDPHPKDKDHHHHHDKDPHHNDKDRHHQVKDRDHQDMDHHYHEKVQHRHKDKNHQHKDKDRHKSHHHEAYHHDLPNHRHHDKDHNSRDHDPDHHDPHHGHHPKGHDSHHLNKDSTRQLKDHDSHHHHSKEQGYESAHHVHHISNDHHHHAKGHSKDGDRHHHKHPDEFSSDSHHSKDHDHRHDSKDHNYLSSSSHRSKDHDDRHHLRDHDHHTRDHDHPHWKDPDHHHRKDQDHHHRKEHDHPHSSDQDQHHHSEDHDRPHSKDQEDLLQSHSRHFKDHRHHTKHDVQQLKDSAHQEHSNTSSNDPNDVEFLHSGSNNSNAEDSSRILEGPTTPPHFAEHQKKHPKPFANVIRKWRNSIS